MNDVGGKLRGLSIIVLIVGVIIAVIVSISMMDVGVLEGIVSLVGIILCTLILGFSLYGLGQIVENTDEIAKHYKRINKEEDRFESEAAVQRLKAEVRSARSKLRAEDTAGDVPIDLTCPQCGEQLTFTKAEMLENIELKCPECGGKIDTLRYR